MKTCGKTKTSKVSHAYSQVALCLVMAQLAVKLAVSLSHRSNTPFFVHPFKPFFPKALVCGLSANTRVQPLHCCTVKLMNHQSEKPGISANIGDSSMTAVFPNLAFGIRENATPAQIDEAYFAIFSWFVSQFSRKGGLDDLEYLMNRLGNPHHHLKAVHVAGTNGKGSVSEKIMEGLHSASLPSIHIGLFTSPHISSIRERLRINGTPITKSDFIRLFHRIVVAARNEDEVSLHPVSFFEMLTAMMFVYFYEGPNIDPFVTRHSSSINTLGTPSSIHPPYCDFVVIETGIGGRLDATNVLPPSSVICSVITSIGWDHMELLGSTLEKIASEKAGILKLQRPVVLGPQACHFQSIEKRITELQCYPVVEIQPHETKQFESFDLENQRIADSALRIALGSKWNSDDPKSIAALNKRPQFRCQRLSDEDLRRSVEVVAKHLGRSTNQINAPPAIYLDVGHNRTALHRAVSEIFRAHPHQPFRILCSLSVGRKIDCLEDVADLFASDEVSNKRLLGFHYLDTKHFRIRSTQSVLRELLQNSQSDDNNAKATSTYQRLEYLILESSDLLESILLPESLRPSILSSQRPFTSNEQQLSYVSYSYRDGLASIYRQCGEESSVLIICGTFFVMQDVAGALGIPLFEADPLETNERRLPKFTS